MRLGAALTRDWPLKLTSIALAVMLWLVASAEEPASGVLSVDVRVQPPPGRRVVRAPDRIRATVVGPRRDLLRLATTPLILTRLLPDTLTADSVQLDLQPLDLVLPHDITARVQDVEPRRVTVELDPVTQRMVPVRAVVQVAPDSGFELADGIAVAPSEVRIAGPPDAVRQIDSVRTVPLRVGRADGPTQEILAIDTNDLGRVRVYPRRVSVSLEVEAMDDRTLDGVAVRLASAAAAGLRPERDTVTVYLHGPRERLGGLTRDSVVVTVDAPPGAAGRAPLRLLLPPRITGTVVPDSVTLLRRSERG
ncbi:MAG TPA: hypothetical protein VFK09_07825 [Gemmatimonadales bacterium]|nr:hypothetical protein [Gemmatimonadales bacterium]